MKRKLLYLLTALTFRCAIAQEAIATTSTNSVSSDRFYQLWFDVGFYPSLGGHYSGDFLPTFAIRLGLGRTFRIIQLCGFLEFTDHKFDPHGGIGSYTFSNGTRYDIAAYAAGTILGVFFLGGGIYYTHQDDVITREYYSYPSPTEEHSGVRSHLALYYLVGLQLQVELSREVSIPIGLYYRDQDYRKNIFPFSLRIGIIYDL